MRTNICAAALLAASVFVMPACHDLADEADLDETSDSITDGDSNELVAGTGDESDIEPADDHEFSRDVPPGPYALDDGSPGDDVLRPALGVALNLVEHLGLLARAGVSSAP